MNERKQARAESTNNQILPIRLEAIVYRECLESVVALAELLV